MDIELSSIEKKVIPKKEVKEEKVYCELIVQNFYKIQIVKNDITDEKVDAITNTANNKLARGAGLAEEIVLKGGP